MKLLIFGPPGSGKGTTAKLYADAVGLTHISSGDMFRREIAAGTLLGKNVSKLLQTGALVDDATTSNLVFHQLEGQDDFILDGFPRTLRQATDLLSQISINGVISIELSDDKIIHRISQRRVCPRDGSSYHLLFKPPKVDGKCDRCSAKLIQREDDTPSVVKSRLSMYRETTAPALDFLRSQNIPCITIQGDYDLKSEWPSIIRRLRAWQRVVESQL